MDGRVVSLWFRGKDDDWLKHEHVISTNVTECLELCTDILVLVRNRATWQRLRNETGVRKDKWIWCTGLVPGLWEGRKNHDDFTKLERIVVSQWCRGTQRLAETETRY